LALNIGCKVTRLGATTAEGRDPGYLGGKLKSRTGRMGHPGRGHRVGIRAAEAVARFGESAFLM
jgi:hypothetical protein